MWATFLRKGVKSSVLAGVMLASTGVCAYGVTLTVFTDPHPVVSGGTIGFTYAGDMFVGSVQANGLNVLYKTDLTGGNVQVFAPTVSVPGGSLSDEHFVASSLGLGGFPSRDIYVANGANILHINHAGTTSNQFVTGLGGLVRGITFDSIGTFNYDMLVTTTSGQVYRVNSAGAATQIANLGADTEGLDVAPLGANFGGFDGQLIVASEGTGVISAISNTNVVTTVFAGIGGGPEELTFVPLNLGISGNPVEGFYGANYTQNVLKGAANQWTPYIGDAIITLESANRITRLHWNQATQQFEYSDLGIFGNQPEDGIFVTAAIIHAGVPLPSAAISGLVLGGGLVFGRLLRRRQASR